MHNNKFNLLIVGYGAIGRLISKFTHKNLEKVYIYTGRSKVNFKSEKIHSFNGELESILDLNLFNKIKNLIVIYCVGPDKEEGYEKSTFFKKVYCLPRDFIKKLSSIQTLNTKFIHISTMIGFDDLIVSNEMSSTQKLKTNNDLYAEAKKKLDIFVESFRKKNIKCVNLRISNLITSDYESSQRKILVRLAKNVLNGESILLEKDLFLDMITEEQLISALTEEFFSRDSNISKNVVNEKVYKLEDLYKKFVFLVKNDDFIGEIKISQIKRSHNIVPRYISSFPDIVGEPIDSFAEELHRHAKIN